LAALGNSILLVLSSATLDIAFAVFKLVEGQDVQQTEASIEEYKKANFGNIVANEAKKVLLYFFILHPARNGNQCMNFMGVPAK